MWMIFLRLSFTNRLTSISVILNVMVFDGIVVVVADIDVVAVAVLLLMLVLLLLLFCC